MKNLPKDLAFRWLEPEEFNRLLPVFQQHGWTLPHPAVGSVFVAEENGEIVGFVSVEMMPHLGPAWIAEGHRRNAEIWAEGLEAIRARLEPKGIFPGVIATAETPMTEKLVERIGMERAKGVLYFKSWR